jgi:putative SOS response-associated peptidase YedK
MCGRYAQSLNTSELAEEFGIGAQTPAEELPSSWNIAPTNPIYIVRASQSVANQRELSTASWGIMAHWHQSESEARASQSHAINARSESIHEKPTFRSAFRTQRCLIPADGYYEWATALGKYSPKQPFYISSTKTRSLPIAGIWSTWKSMEGDVIQSAAIITREAVNELATIHSRMPVMMPRDRWDAWLDPGQHEVELLISLMSNPQPDDGLLARPVSSEVNLVRNNSQRLIQPITLGEPETLF